MAESCLTLEVRFGVDDYYLSSVNREEKEIVLTRNVTKRLLFDKMVVSELFEDSIKQVLLSNGYQADVKSRLVFGEPPFLDEIFCKNLPTIGYNVFFEGEAPSEISSVQSEEQNHSVTFEGENLSKNSYYNKGPVECFDALIASRGVHNFVEFCIQNAQTYLWRAGDKPDQPLLKDLIKTGVFINKAVEVLQKFEEGKIDEYGNSRED